MGGEYAHTLEQLTCCYLMANITRCLHNDQVDCRDTFICLLPSYMIT